MIDYILILALMIIGIGYDINRKITRHKKLFPQLTGKEIINTYVSEEINTLFTSALNVALIEIALYIVRINEVQLPDWFELWGMYVFALVWGYAGQRLAYKILGTTEAVLEKKVDKIKETNL